jgi:hypothetical protein
MGCQCQLAAGDQVELPCLAPNLQHDSTHRIAGQRVRSGPQCTVHIRCAHAHEKTRIKTELGYPAHRQRARFNFGKILSHPHQRPLRDHSRCEPRDKTGCGGTLPASLGEHLVQCA